MTQETKNVAELFGKQIHTLTQEESSAGKERDVLLKEYLPTHRQVRRNKVLLGLLSKWA